MGYYDIRQISPFLAGPSIIVSISQDYRHYPHHYDTPGTFDKNLLVCHRISRPLDSVPSNLKVKPALQTAQHMAKQMKKLHTSKVKHTQTEQSERRENRYQTHNNESRNEYSHIQ